MVHDDVGEATVGHVWPLLLHPFLLDKVRELKDGLAFAYMSKLLSSFSRISIQPNSYNHIFNHILSIS